MDGAHTHGHGPTGLGELVVLASSVTRNHAELREVDGAWTVRDLGSRNGTFVDSVRVQGRTPLPPRGLLKVGDVALWFLAEVMHEPAPPPTARTTSRSVSTRARMSAARTMPRASTTSSPRPVGPWP